MSAVIRGGGGGGGGGGSSTASVNGEAKERKPILIDRVDGFECDIYGAILLPNEDGFISISDDRLDFFLDFFLDLEANFLTYLLLA